MTKSEKNIKAMDKKKKGFGILAMIFNPLKWIQLGIIVLGGLILIGLARFAFAQWKKTYMP